MDNIRVSVTNCMSGVRVSPGYPGSVNYVYIFFFYIWKFELDQQNPTITIPFRILTWLELSNCMK